MIYLASYKHKRKVTNFKTAKFALFDWLIRKTTKGKYSHSEIVIKREDGLYDCYSSSIRDGGVRKKTMHLKPERWDLIAIEADEKEVIDYYEKTKHQKYDFLGAMGVILPFSEDQNKQFCSEWCYNEIYKCNQGWRHSPTLLHINLQAAKQRFFNAKGGYKCQ